MIQKFYINDRYIRIIPTPANDDETIIIEYADKAVSSTMTAATVKGQRDYELPKDFDATRIIDVTLEKK